MMTFRVLLFFSLLPLPALAENLYVTSTGAGTRDGTSWANAFAGFNGIVWGPGAAQLGEDDILWIAGGSYAGPLVIQGSGSDGHRIVLQRATAGDVMATSAAGWNDAFDAPVVISGASTGIYFSHGVGSYVTIDGRTTSGIRCVYGDHNNGVEIDATPDTITGITLRYIEAAGPGPIQQSGDTRGFDLTVTGLIVNLTLSHCSAHHSDTLFQIAASVGLVVEYCDFHDADALNPDTFHPNTMILTKTEDAVIRFNRLHNIRVEGLFFESGASNNVQIYGNLFYVGTAPRDSGRGIEVGSNAAATNFRIYNNTFVDLPFRGLRLSGISHAGTVVENNIFYRTTADFGDAAHDYNLYTGQNDEPNGIGHAPNPFVNLESFDYHLIAATGPRRARDRGRDLGPTYQPDLDGNLRGADGAWDIGAYEYHAGGAPVVTSAPQAAGGYRLDFSYQIAASPQPVAFAVSGALPPGLVLDPVTGRIAGRPAWVGTYEVVISGSNAAGAGGDALTIAIAPSALTLAGAGIASRAFNGTVAATLDLSAAQLVGLAPEDTGAVGLDASAVVAAYDSPNVGTNKPVTFSGLALNGAAAPCYSLLPFSLTGTITPAVAFVTLGQLDQLYDGSPRTVTVTTTPAGLGTAVTYAGNVAAPVAPGSYDVVATVVDPNYSGSVSARLTIQHLSQSVQFPTPAGSLRIGEPVTLQANASSGLPVTFAVVSGNATLAGDRLTALSTAPVTVRATQAGNDLYAPASAEITLSNIDNPSRPPTIISPAVATGTYRVPFSYAILASESVDRYGISGSLPAGLALDPASGVIGGTPTDSGVFTFTISTANDDGTDSLSFTVTIAPLEIAATGIAAISRNYDGSVAVALDLATAALAGVPAEDLGRVTLNTAGATGAFQSPAAGTAKSVAISGLALAGTAAAHYRLRPLAVTASILPAPALIRLGNLEHLFDGTRKTASLVVTPPGLPTAITYGGQSTAPLAAGSYEVIATVTDPNYTGRVTAVLHIFDATAARAALLRGAAPGAPVSLAVTATGGVQWLRDGLALSGATQSVLAFPAVAPADAGIYTATFDNGTRTLYAILGVLSASKVLGAAIEIPPADVVHPNGNVYDQTLLTGSATTISADPGQATRLSFIDLNNDIVQVEFAGAGTLTLLLDDASGPGPAANYNQPQVRYIKGHARIVIADADETSHVTIFTVGRATAFDESGAYDITRPVSATNDPMANRSPLFTGHDDTAYDGFADLAYLAIQARNGRFGGLRAGNAAFFATHGITGVFAPDVIFTGPVYVHDITASDAAVPTLLLGACDDVRVAGGNLAQDNAAPVRVSGIHQLRFTDGMSSAGRILLAQANRATLEQDGTDITAQIVLNPTQ